MTSAGKVLVLGTALVMSCLGCSSEDGRYELSTDARGRTYKLDKKTGEMWLVTSVGERSISKGTATQQVVPLPSSALGHLTGKMKQVTRGEFWLLHLHNGTDDWDVVSVEILMRGPGWSKRYRTQFNDPADKAIPPRITKALYITTRDTDTSGMTSWTVVGATGHESTAH